MSEQDWQAGDVFYVVREDVRGVPQLLEGRITRRTPHTIFTERCRATSFGTRYTPDYFPFHSTEVGAAAAWREQASAALGTASHRLTVAEKFYDAVRRGQIEATRG